MHSSDFGWVIVVDEADAPIEGAEVGVIGKVIGADSCLTGTNGVARVTAFPASVVGEWSRHAAGIRASHSDFLTTTSAFPCPWPVRITLRPKPR